jgi:hypothetical protein
MKYLASLMLVVVVHTARSQIVFDGTALNYSQNFDSLGTGTVAWTDNSTLPGWYLWQTVSGGSSPATVLTSTGNNSGAAAYNVGVAGVNSVDDRALGFLTGSTTGTGYVGVQLQNESGQNYVGDVSITFTYEQWSARNVTSDPLTLAWKTMASTGNQLGSTGGNPPWTTLATIASPNLSNTGGGTTHYIDGNAPGNYTTVTEMAAFTSDSPWSAGTYLWFRTADSDVSGNDDLNAIDDVSISVDAVPEPATWSFATFAAMLSLCMFRQRKSSHA